jgi:hypothetical protein
MKRWDGYSQLVLLERTSRNHWGSKELLSSIYLYIYTFCYRQISCVRDSDVSANWNGAIWFPVLFESRVHLCISHMTFYGSRIYMLVKTTSFVAQWSKLTLSKVLNWVASFPLLYLMMEEVAGSETSYSLNIPATMDSVEHSNFVMKNSPLSRTFTRSVMSCDWTVPRHRGSVPWYFFNWGCAYWSAEVSSTMAFTVFTAFS